jgi:aminopeptidase N
MGTGSRATGKSLYLPASFASDRGCGWRPVAEWHAYSMPTLQIASYDVAIDLTGGPRTFSSRTEIHFGCEPGMGAAAGVLALNIRRAVLNGADLQDAAVGDSLQLARLGGDNTLIVEAEFAYAQPGGVGLIRETGPEGSACVYSKAHRGGAPHIFCCFDQLDLRAPFTLSVRAPIGWACLANASVAGRNEGKTTALWTFATTRPIAPYLFSMCAGLSAGPRLACQRRDGSPLTVAAHALPPAVELLDAALGVELFQQPLRYYESTLVVRYPDDKYDVAFLPQYGPGLAFGAPGLLTTREEVLNLKDKRETYLAIVIAHELAHTWFGGLIEFQSPGDEWLEEAITTYVSRSALEARYPHINPWSAATSESLPDHAYAKNAGLLKQLETMIGRQAVMDGIGDLLRHQANRTVTKDNLARSWSLASGQDLGEWTANQLIPVPPDQP